jgi:FlaA1/EpsC-like NDP-sugar epimerase
VTDERMSLYFMTIPEAVQLIIRAGSLHPLGDGSNSAGAAGPEILVLDMGEPVRIIDLARAMIELSGLDARQDIEIEIVGRRPGEKLHEELFNVYERPQPTPAEKIMLAQRSPLPRATVESWFEEIALLVATGDAAAVTSRVFECAGACAELVSDRSGLPPTAPAPAGAILSETP